MASLPIVSQFIVSSTLSVGEVRRSFSLLKPTYLKRLLYLKEGSFLAVCASTVEKVEGAIEAEAVQSFIRESAEELMEVGRMIAVINGESFRTSVLRDRLAIIRDGDKDAFISVSDESEDRNRLSIKTIIDPTSIDVLKERADGVRLFYDASISEDLAFHS